MLVIKCQNCQKRIIWDDFQADDVICPKCHEVAKVSSMLSDNIERREHDAENYYYHCPSCRHGIKSRLFKRCPGCGRLVMGRIALHTKTQVLLLFMSLYLIWGLIKLIGMVG